ncbi:dynein light chain Tctex-type 5-B-like [Gigantopelta aegis]|uniref:dynein light chain Tctex-type 5-B-like n=1 Tax=Gigantopelta aegis TaxID=1735272 RepID=UPI001B887C7D|nr:dynein light chain Tctex-type 5-B-like [Gigantopelta aegis]XP_041358262.1 dynein light chain Tctex-type 5-B-like [Gigantopelta aegis]
MDTLQERKSSLHGSSILSFYHEPIDETRQTRKLGAVENTYQLDPPKRFHPDRVTKIIKQILETHLSNMEYNHEVMKSTTKMMTEELKVKVKELNLKRYKLITHVMVVENKDQGIRIGSRFLWDTERDSFASASFKNKTLFATGIVYACYYE